MDALLCLSELTSQMHLEPAEEMACPRQAPAAQDKPHSRKPDPFYVGHALLPNGKQIKLLKTLLTSACERNCNYCPFRAGRDFRRATLKSDQMAGVFSDLHRAGIAEGIFLSSGITGGSIRTQDQLIATAEILRFKRQFRGYLHLKLMPGAEQAQVERAMQLADRVSLNLEAPNTRRLEMLAPRKAFLEELLQPMRWVDEIRRTRSGRLGWNQHWPSMTTQFVVGAVGESDLEILSTTAYLHKNLHLARAYFSAFNPVADTPFENMPPTAPVRQQRLYQASFLIRDYGFDLEEMPFTLSGDLPTEVDPKTAWAEQHLRDEPFEINRATRHELLRVPGIGPKSAEAILSARRHGTLRSEEDLHKIGVNPTRAIPFILLDGRSPGRQLKLW
jgi:predicted DNA-binding helix-hairpin-helix protein